jgi:hypothetical protein
VENQKWEEWNKGRYLLFTHFTSNRSTKKGEKGKLM